MDEMKYLQMLATKNEIQSIIKTNEITKRFGLTLSEKDVKELVEEKNLSLETQERIEFRGSIIAKLIFTFCDSQYIYQSNYLETIIRLQEIFYLYKNESLDELSDDELLEYMKKEFEGECQGDVDYLEATSLEKFARIIREGDYSWRDRYFEK